MDAEQRYIRESKYTLEHNFLDALTSVPLSVSMRVAKFIDQCYDQISASEKEHRTYGGVVHVAGEAVFFSVEVMIDEELTYLLDFNVISSDEYLDFILMKSYLKK